MVSAEFRPGIPRSELPQVWSYSRAPVDTSSESIERLGVGLPLSRLHVTGLEDNPPGRLDPFGSIWGFLKMIQKKSPWPMAWVSKCFNTQRLNSLLLDGGTPVLGNLHLWDRGYTVTMM